MKKIITLTLALTLSFGGFTQQYNLGKVSFATDSVWIISGNGITQIWSDAVQTDSCGCKTSFNGGDYSDNYNIDCRSNPDQKGDLFSWCAVNELKNELCPAPWRVPTKQDFINLDIALGGTGEGQDSSTHVIKYLNDWGGVLANFCDSKGRLYSPFSWNPQNWIVNYWSQSTDEYDSNNYGLCLEFNAYYNSISPCTKKIKEVGFPLRCVRDN